MKDRFDVYRQKINERISESRLRSLPAPSFYEQSSIRENESLHKSIDFCSNDYLGFSLRPDIILAAQNFTAKYGTGSRSSRLVSGNLDCHVQLEEELASFFRRGDALVFNTGYQGNMAIISSLCNRQTIIYADKLIHNSLLQGCLLSGAKLLRYRHNDTHHLEQLLQQNIDSRNQLIVTESVFSMDGDIAPLETICDLADKYNSLLLVDDAHAVGVLGKKGKGLAYEMDRIDFVTGTFGKSFGALGGYVLCSSEMKQYFVNYASGFIYSTGIQPSTVGAVLEGLKLLEGLESARNEIQIQSQMLRKGLNQLGYHTGNSSSQIIPMIIGSDKETLKMCTYLHHYGIKTVAIRPPTVPKGKARIRFTITIAHKRTDIENLLDIISKYLNYG